MGRVNALVGDSNGQLSGGGGGRGRRQFLQQVLARRHCHCGQGARLPGRARGLIFIRRAPRSQGDTCGAHYAYRQTLAAPARVNGSRVADAAAAKRSRALASYFWHDGLPRGHARALAAHSAHMRASPQQRAPRGPISAAAAATTAAVAARSPRRVSGVKHIRKQQNAALVELAASPPVYSTRAEECRSSPASRCAPAIRLPGTVVEQCDKVQHDSHQPWGAGSARASAELAQAHKKTSVSTIQSGRARSTTHVGAS